MRHAPLLLLLFALATAALLLPAPARAQACATVSAGLDTVGSNSAFFSSFNEGLGQTFVADDTVVTSVTLWEPPGGGPYVLQHGTVLVLTRTYVDSSAGFRSPALGARVATSGVVYPDTLTSPDGPYPLRFVFDPPLVLPALDLYALFVYPAGPSAAVNFGLMIDQGVNAYAPGMYWITNRRGDKVLGGGGNDDLCFLVEYCTDAPVPARHMTWGELKQLYR